MGSSMTDLELISIIREAGRRWRELQAQAQTVTESDKPDDQPSPVTEAVSDEQKCKGGLPIDTTGNQVESRRKNTAQNG
jgi:hypothetical protein